MKRYCSKENYLRGAAAIENGAEYRQEIIAEDLRAMQAAEQRAG